MVFKEVELSKNISYNDDGRGKVQHRVYQLPSIFADILKEMDTWPQNQAAEMENALETITDAKIEKIVDEKVQAAFTEAFGSY